MRRLTFAVLAFPAALILILGCGGVGGGLPTALCNDGTLSFSCTEMCFWQGGVQENFNNCDPPTTGFPPASVAGVRPPDG